MKAIDFAVRLTAKLLKYKNELSLMDAGILFAVAAGLDYAPDIADTLQRPGGSTVTGLHRLAKAGLIHPTGWTDAGTPLYKLTHDGKLFVFNLLNYREQ